VDVADAAESTALLLAYYGNAATNYPESATQVLVEEFRRLVSDIGEAKLVIERCAQWYPNFVPNVAQLRAAIRDVQPRKEPEALPEHHDSEEEIAAAREEALAKVRGMVSGEGKTKSGSGSGLGEVADPSPFHRYSTLTHPECMLPWDHKAPAGKTDNKCLPPPYVDDRRFDR
jgi:hypothetical protein